MILTDFSIKNRTTVAILGLIVIFLGCYSYFTLPREAFPDIPIPYILVDTVYEGVSPADIETSVTMKIEKELNGIRGVKEVRSSSAEGLSTIVVEFTPDVPTDVALQRVRDRVDVAKGDLPTDAQEPIIQEINLAEFPIMQVSISGDVSPAQLKGIADKVQDELETLPGILKVDVLGALEPEIRMEFDRDRMALYNLVVADIMQLIPTENVNISAGGLETKGTKFNVRIPAEFVSPEEVDHLLIAVRDGKPIYLADVATVRDAFKDRTSYSRVDGRDNVTLSIQKRAGANVVQVADSIKAALAEARETAPRRRHLRRDFRHVEVHPRSGGRPGEQHGLRADPRGRCPAAVPRLAVQHDRLADHPVQHARQLLPPPGAGLHAQHDRAVQPDPRLGHAGGLGDRDRGEHLPAHGAGRVTNPGGHSGNARGRLARDYLDLDQRSQLHPDDLLAGDHGRFHEVPAHYGHHRPDDVLVRGPGLQPDVLRDGRRGTSAKPVERAGFSGAIGGYNGSRSPSPSVPCCCRASCWC